MNDTPAETLYLEDRTDWSPQPRWRADRRGALTVLAALGVFVGLLGVSWRHEARASTRTAVVRNNAPVCIALPSRPRRPCSRAMAPRCVEGSVHCCARGDSVRAHVVGP